MIDKCSCGANCSQVEKLQAEIERLKAEMGPLYPEIEDLNAQCNKYDSEIERLKELHLSDYWSAKRAVQIFSTEYVGQDQAVLWKAIVAEVQALQVEQGE